MTNRSGYILQCSQTSPPHPDMKLLVIAVCALACVRAGVSRGRVGRSVEQEATVLRSENKVEPNAFHYAFETSNGIATQADGELKAFGDSEALVARGSFQYVSPNGTPVQNSYVADENGYQPQGPHIPTSPPIPAYILRSIEYSRTHQPMEGSRP